MPQTAELAERLVEYDQRLARDVLEMICERLGGPASEGAPDVEEMRLFLSQPDSVRAKPLSRLGDVSDAPSTTEEWKSEFSHHERLRTLGARIAELLT